MIWSLISKLQLAGLFQISFSLKFILSCLIDRGILSQFIECGTQACARETTRGHSRTCEIKSCTRKLKFLAK
jgi:hypothetical protein